MSHATMRPPGELTWADSPTPHACSDAPDAQPEGGPILGLVNGVRLMLQVVAVVVGSIWLAVQVLG
jgi:hypothetical protein